MQWMEEKMICCGWTTTRKTTSYLLSSGPVLSRFDRFLLIGPRAKGGPALRLTYQRKLALSIEAACV